MEQKPLCIIIQIIIFKKYLYFIMLILRSVGNYQHYKILEYNLYFWNKNKYMSPFGLSCNVHGWGITEWKLLVKSVTNVRDGLWFWWHVTYASKIRKVPLCFRALMWHLETLQPAVYSFCDLVKVIYHRWKSICFVLL